MTVVDGFVAAVPHAKKAEFEAHAAAMAVVFKRHGALRVVDTWQHDVPRGKRTDFFMSVQATADEAVSFGWVEWPSAEARESGWAKCMADPEMMDSGTPPFDGARMIYGAFSVISDK